MTFTLSSDRHINTLIIIPHYNEQHLDEILQPLLQTEGIHMLTIDDGSEPIYTLKKNHSKLYKATHPINLGQGAALQTGLEIAKLLAPDYIITMDADGQHHPDSIHDLRSAILQHQVDIIFGRRDLATTEGISILRKIILRLGIYFNWFYTGVKLNDAHNGYRIMNKKAYLSIVLKEDGMAHATEILEEVKRNKLTYAETVVKIQYTDYSKAKGQSSLNAFSIVKQLIFRRLQ